MTLSVSSVRKHLKSFNLPGLFIESLGWNQPEGREAGTINIEGKKISYGYVAQINDIPILEIEENSLNGIEKKIFHKKIKQRHEKHLIIFRNKNCLSFSYFTQTGRLKEHRFFKGQNGDSLIGKLAGIHVGVNESDPGILEISKRIDDSFNTDDVTRKFYYDFKSTHHLIQDDIVGIKDKKEKHWYSLIILNRLMFIWFVQKKDLRIMITTI